MYNYKYIDAHQIATMVTTIKITCDGVFIQSNSFLTNSHMARVDGHHPSLQDRNALLYGDTTTYGHGRHVGISSNSRSTLARSQPAQTITMDGRENWEGNLRIVIRNNRRKIDQSEVVNLKRLTAESNKLGCSDKVIINANKDKEEKVEEEDLYNKIHVRDKTKYQENNGVRKDSIGGTEDNNKALVRSVSKSSGGYRPPQHYMYMVRKVSSKANSGGDGGGGNMTTAQTLMPVVLSRSASNPIVVDKSNNRNGSVRERGEVVNNEGSEGSGNRNPLTRSASSSMAVTNAVTLLAPSSSTRPLQLALRRSLEEEEDVAADPSLLSANIGQ